MKTAWKGFMQATSIYDQQTSQWFFVQHDMFTAGAGYLDLKAALASTEKTKSGKLALSPRAVFSNGKVTLSNSYPTISGSSVVWGTADPFSEALSIRGDQ